MMADLLLAVAMLCGAVWELGVGAQCSDQQNCVCEATFMICRDRNPSPGAPVSTRLTPPTADINVAEVLAGGVLPANLTEIYLHDSPIKSIHEDAFDGSSFTVITLSLSNCQLTSIPQALSHLQALKYLTISDTNIQEWNSDVMSSIGPHVITCFFSNVGLNIWPAWMKSFTNVSEFSFEGSSVYSIPDDAFELMTALTSLSLANNKLPVVPRALSGVQTLQSLYLEDNVITDITWLPTSSLLSTLSLGGNKLSNSTHLSQALLPFANSLADLDVSHNRLTSIPELDFLIQVDSLDFSSNLLSDTNAGRFPGKLYYLDMSLNVFSSIPHFTLSLQFVTKLALSSNVITEIQGTDFASCITFVQLDKNRIIELTDTSFPPGSGILSLVLDYNPLRAISLSAFRNLQNLTNLSLRNSLLTRLPLALTSLTKLTSFDISGSRDLVCKCMEKDLKNWVVSTSRGMLSGVCGMTSIYLFFTALSPRCPVLYNGVIEGL